MLAFAYYTEYEILLDKTDFIYQSYGSNLNGVGSWLISSMNQTAVQQYGYTQTLKNFENTIEIPCFPQSMQSYAVQMGKEIIPLITEIDTKIRFHDRVIRVAIDDEQDEEEEEREKGESDVAEQEQHADHAISPEYYSSFGSFNSKAGQAGRDPSEAPATPRIRPRRRRQRTVYRTVTTMDIHEQKIIDDLIKGLLLVQARQTDAILRLTRFHILSSLNVCEDLLLVWKSKLVQKTQAFRLPIPRSVLKYIPGFGRRIRTNALQSLQQALNNMNIGSISRDFNFNFIKQFQIQQRNQQQQQQPVPIVTPRRPWWNPFHRSQAPPKNPTAAAVPVGKDQTPTEATKEELPEDWPPTEQLNFRVVSAKRGVNRLVFEPLQNTSSATDSDVGDDLTNATSAERDNAESDTKIDDTDEVSATDPLSPANRVINRLLKGLNTREKVLYLEVIQFELYDMAGKIQLQLDQLEPIGNQLTASCKEETLLSQQYNILDQAGRDMQPVKPSSDGPGVADEPSSDSEHAAVPPESVLVSFQRNHKWDTRRKRLLMALSDSTTPASGVNSEEPQGAGSDGVIAPSYHSAWDDLDVWISRSSALCKESLSLVYLDRHYQSSPFLSRSPSSPVYPSPQPKSTSTDASPSELTATRASAEGIKTSNDASQPSSASASTAKPQARSKRDELMLDIAAEKEGLAAAGPGPLPLRDAERAMEASFLKIDERHIQENQVCSCPYLYYYVRV